MASDKDITNVATVLRVSEEEVQGSLRKTGDIKKTYYKLRSSRHEKLGVIGKTILILFVLGVLWLLIDSVVESIHRVTFENVVGIVMPALVLWFIVDRYQENRKRNKA